MLFGQIFLAADVNDKPDQHTDTSRTKSIVPAVKLTQCPHYQGRSDNTRIDTQVEDLESIGTAQITGAV